MILHRSSGFLRYFSNPYKLILEVDNEIARYYRALCPRALGLRIPMYPAHISIVRNSTPERMEYWGQYEGREMEFDYEEWVYNDEIYFWLNCYSVSFNGEGAKTFEEIRTELGLLPHDKTSRSPDGRCKFHMTIGNIKQ